MILDDHMEKDRLSGRVAPEEKRKCRLQYN
jgi:hypothetical protein